MEGYSVTEAASVLGVPTERVWELLARGVLAGQPDGESGMRVFLQPRSAAAPSRMDLPPPDPPPAREPERELSPFRELLTEFRNLTERYGQALLALGEARGEVASLRSRVDLLEARMDLRLPMGAPVTASVGWEGPIPVSPPARTPAAQDAAPPMTVEPVADPEPEETADETTAAAVVVDVTPQAGDSAGEVLTTTPTATEAAGDADDVTGAAEVIDDRPSGIDGDAEAIDDTSDEEPHRRRRAHPHATEQFAEALARAEDPTVPELPEPHREPMPDMPAVEGAFPRELPAAEPIPSIDEDAAVAWSVDRSQPESVATQRPDEDATAEEQPATGFADDSVSRVEGEVEGPVLEGADEIGGEAVAQVAGAPDVEAPGEAPIVGWDVEPQAAEEPDASASTDAEDEDEGPAEPLVWDPERYTTEIGEPDWYAEETPPVLRTEPGGAAARESWVEDRDEDHPAVVAGQAAAEPSAADDAEPALRAEPGTPEEASAEPPAEPSDDPLDRLDALARSTESQPAADASWPRTDPVTEYRSALRSAGQGSPVRPGSPPTTASRAYRRLRRIFPG